MATRNRHIFCQRRNRPVTLSSVVSAFVDMVREGAAIRLQYALGNRRPQAGSWATFGDVIVVVCLLIAGLHVLVWRADMLPRIGVAGWALFFVEALTVVWMLITAMLLTGRTGPRRVPPAPDPGATLDVLIPVAGEPLDMVAATVATAKAIRWPHMTITVCNDGWMAGSANWHDIELLCRRLGVACLTRRGGAKGKAGNLNHAMARTTADLVLTVDADHQVVPDIAEELLGWFRHGDVGFVSTPQTFMGADRDQLNPTEPVFYRAIQPARDRFGIAFSTGNCAVYRRTALDEIGGFSEWSVVEDLHTSIRLHDARWQSVYHPRPVSVGVAPKTSAEYARQRLRWAIDSLRILRHDPPWRRRGLDLRAKIHYTHTLTAHVVVMFQLGFLLGPPAWILGRLRLLSDGDWQPQLLHIGPWLAMVIIALVRWAGVRGAIRTFRLGVAFLPVVFLVAAWRTWWPESGRGTVTAKTNLPRVNGLVLGGLVLPTFLLFTITLALFDNRPGGSDVAMGWATLMLSLAIGPLVVGYRRFWPGLIKTTVIAASIAMTAGSVATARLGWEAPGGLYESFQVDPGSATAVLETNEFGDVVVTGPAVEAGTDVVASAAADLQGRPGPDVDGVTRRVVATEDIYIGFTSDSLPYELEEADRWAADVTEPQIVHWYQQWGSGESRFRGDWFAAVDASGRVPMVSWEAWAKPEGSFHKAEQELGNMADVADGDYDEYIDEWATAAARYGRPILLRPFHEMNGYWYPWSVGVNGNSEEDFVAGWRHVVDRFRAAGADNVSFVWSINTLASFERGEGVEDIYPGDAYVDWVGASGFNWDDYDPSWSSWVEADWVFGQTYELLTTFDKPIMFAEVGTGTNSGDGSQWVSDAMSWFETLPDLRAVVWFDRSYDGSVDFRLHRDQQEAIAEAVAADGSRFGPTFRFVEHQAVAAASVTN